MNGWTGWALPGCERVVVEVPPGRHHHGQSQDEEDRPAPVAPAPGPRRRERGGCEAIGARQPGRADRWAGTVGGRWILVSAGVGAGRHQPHVVVVLGHSGGVVAPEPSDPPAARKQSGDAVMKPAMEPTDSRVTSHEDSAVTARRRLVALAGHRGDRAAARSGLADPAPSVRATALGALDRLGALTDTDLLASLADPAPSVRRRASELAATHPAVPIAALLDDGDPSVVEMSAWSLGERGDRSAVGPLAALASAAAGHRDPLCREAAVAALGRHRRSRRPPRRARRTG